MKSKELEPAVIVLFGITGDLSQRYLLPALYHLFKDKVLNEKFEILGLTRQDLTASQLFEKVEVCIYEEDKICDAEALKALRQRTTLMTFDPTKTEDYQKLKARLDNNDHERGSYLNRIYQLSIPPNIYSTVMGNLGASGLNMPCADKIHTTRVVIEKPFGRDFDTARDLIDSTTKVFDETQIFRVDHYLAKETVQNILTFRMSNPIFSQVWNDKNISSIEINALESIGIEGRVNFYEGLGAVRDLIQSHLIQLLTLVTMELPEKVDDSEDIHAKKYQLLKGVLPIDPNNALRAQYEGYLDEVGKAESTTETYANLDLSIDNDMWRNTKIRLVTGKALTEKRTDITIRFRSPADSNANVLVLRIQPNEGIHMEFWVKRPGYVHQLERAVMDFSYQSTFGETNHPDAYERVLVDSIRGDNTLFATEEEVLLSWKIIDKVLNVWDANNDGMLSYKKGSTGPAVDQPNRRSIIVI